MPAKEKTKTKLFRTFECEVRSEQDEEHGTYVSGRPIVFGDIYDRGLFDETIDPGALDETDLKDVRFLVNHNKDMIPLARSRNNNANSTMQLEKDENGLNIRANLDTENNPTAKELYSAIGRGDVTGMSFMFTVSSESWENLDTDYPRRHITGVDKVFEVSAVTFPAYSATTIDVRADAEALESAKATLESAKRAETEKREAELREAINAKLNQILEGRK